MWLADVVSALLTRAQELGLAAWASQRSRPVEGLAVPEGVAWRDCFAAFNDLLVRHLSTLAEVCRVAAEVRPFPSCFDALSKAVYPLLQLPSSAQAWQELAGGGAVSNLWQCQCA